MGGGGGERALARARVCSGGAARRAHAGGPRGGLCRERCVCASALPLLSFSIKLVCVRCRDSARPLLWAESRALPPARQHSRRLPLPPHAGPPNRRALRSAAGRTMSSPPPRRGRPGPAASAAAAAAAMRMERMAKAGGRLVSLSTPDGSGQGVASPHGSHTLCWQPVLCKSRPAQQTNHPYDTNPANQLSVTLSDRGGH